MATIKQEIAFRTESLLSDEDWQDILACVQAIRDGLSGQEHQKIIINSENDNRDSVIKRLDQLVASINMAQKEIEKSPVKLVTPEKEEHE